MARPTRYKANDWVKVTYRTITLRGNYMGKVIEYNRERRQYLVGVVCMQVRRTGSIVPVASRTSIWCRVSELSFLTDDEIKQIKEIDRVAITTNLIKNYFGSQNIQNANSVRQMSRFLMHGHIMTNSLPNDLDKPLSHRVYRPIERHQYFHSASV